MLVMYKGKRGAGKTLTMVKDAFKFLNKGWLVYHNFSMVFGKYIDTKEILAIDKNSEIRNCVLVIDEIQIMFDSRRSMKNVNINFSNFIQQLRKRNIILLTTTQFSNTVDLRLRQHLDVIAEPKYSQKYDVCECKYTDVTSLESENFFNEPTSFTVVFDAKPIYELYNTNTLI